MRSVASPQVLNELVSLHGVGHKTAAKLMAAGLTSVAMIKRLATTAGGRRELERRGLPLNKDLLAALRAHSDLQLRIPRYVTSSASHPMLRANRLCAP